MDTLACTPSQLFGGILSLDGPEHQGEEEDEHDQENRVQHLRHSESDRLAGGNSAGQDGPHRGLIASIVGAVIVLGCWAALARGR